MTISEVVAIVKGLPEVSPRTTYLFSMRPAILVQKLIDLPGLVPLLKLFGRHPQPQQIAKQVAAAFRAGEPPRPGAASTTLLRVLRGRGVCGGLDGGQPYCGCWVAACAQGIVADVFWKEAGLLEGDVVQMERVHNTDPERFREGK